jgi:hypothetical protein
LRPKFWALEINQHVEDILQLYCQDKSKKIPGREPGPYSSKLNNKHANLRHFNDNTLLENVRIPRHCETCSLARLPLWLNRLGLPLPLRANVFYVCALKKRMRRISAFSKQNYFLLHALFGNDMKTCPLDHLLRTAITVW